MRYEKKIGQRVWLFDGTLERGLTLKSKDTFTLKEAKMGPDCGDRFNHFVIEHDSDGQRIEVPEWQVVFAIEGSNIMKYLSDNELYADDVSELPDGTVSVFIAWGDWKHEHGWCDDLMKYLGYHCTTIDANEQNGSDCYSAIHYYTKTA